MLLLTRRVGEKIRIDDNVIIKVISVTGPNVHLGIEAPKNVAVHREEVWVKIQAELEAERLTRLGLAP